MKIKLILLTLLTCLTFNSFSQVFIGIKIDSKKVINVTFTEIKLLFPNDKIKQESLAFLCGSLEYESNKYGKEFQIDSMVSIDTLYEKKDILNQISTYNDSTSYVYESLRIIKKQLEKDKSDFKNGFINQIDYNKYYNEDFLKYKLELYNKSKNKSELLNRLKTVKDKDILSYTITYSIIEIITNSNNEDDVKLKKLYNVYGIEYKPKKYIRKICNHRKTDKTGYKPHNN
jgi:hypothetical protein